MAAGLFLMTINGGGAGLLHISKIGAQSHGAVPWLRAARHVRRPAVVSTCQSRLLVLAQSSLSGEARRGGRLGEAAARGEGRPARFVRIVGLFRPRQTG